MYKKQEKGTRKVFAQLKLIRSINKKTGIASLTMQLITIER